MAGEGGRRQEGGMKKEGSAKQENELSCLPCGIVFSGRKRLAAHKQNYHDISVCIYTCKECGQSYSNRKNLSRHIKKVHSGRPLILSSIKSRPERRGERLSTSGLSSRSAPTPCTWTSRATPSLEGMSYR